MKDLNTVIALNETRHGLAVIVLVLAWQDGTQELKTFLSGTGALNFAAAKLRPHYGSIVAELRSIGAIS